jgi:hypothetical protein
MKELANKMKNRKSIFGHLGRSVHPGISITGTDGFAEL